MRREVPSASVLGPGPADRADGVAPPDPRAVAATAASEVAASCASEQTPPPWWRRLQSGVAHAFAIPAQAFRPTPRQVELVTRLCTAACQRDLGLPALMTLESCQTLGFVAGQSLRVCEPLLSTLVPAADQREVIQLLEHRGGIEYVCRQLELELSRPTRSEVHIPGESLS